MLTRDTLAQFIGEIIDIFEDFLEEKGIEIENGEKLGKEGEAIIYGSDYGQIQTELEETLKGWNLIEEEKAQE